jgi:hypothetical protein
MPVRETFNRSRREYFRRDLRFLAAHEGRLIAHER